MKGFLATLACALAILGAGCLNKQLNPGRCNSTSDCASGQTCDLSPQANGTCVCNSPGCSDGGGAGASGIGGSGGSGSAGAGGAGDKLDGGGQDSTDGPHGCRSAADCSAPTPECGSNGICVECAAGNVSADCPDPTRPICDTATNTCIPCVNDDQCVTRYGSDPGVCMSHVDGHCAIPAEAIYVANQTGCVPASTAVASGDPGQGTIATPLCTMEQIPSLLTSGRVNRDLVVVRGKVSGGDWTFAGQGGVSLLSVIGQQTAQIAGGATPAFAMSSASVYLRGVTLTAASKGISMSGGTLALENLTLFGSSLSDVGIGATAGSLTLKKVTVNGWAGGGILLNGASFDIENTTITNNGPSSDLSWGGVKVQTLPASGSAVFHLVTIQNNSPSGMSCAQGATVQGDGVLASGNSSGDISPTCGITNCQTAGPSCGAQ